MSTVTRKSLGRFEGKMVQRHLVENKHLSKSSTITALSIFFYSKLILESQVCVESRNPSSGPRSMISECIYEMKWCTELYGYLILIVSKACGKNDAAALLSVLFF